MNSAIFLKRAREIVKRDKKLFDALLEGDTKKDRMKAKPTKKV